MTPEEWLALKSALNSALELPSAEREAYLRQEISEEAARDEVRSLIASFEADPMFAEAPAATLVEEKSPAAETPRSIQQYEILRSLGSGGMGDIYLAIDPALGRKVALKVLPAELTRDPDRVRRLEQEARAASSLNHPNIVTVYELGRAGASHFIVEEYVQGVTLRERLLSGPIPLAEVLDIAEQVTAALQVAHGAGVVHRDIKPENIMIRDDGLVKVLDFGLAKFVTPEPKPPLNTSAGIILGTVQYMSPEQARGIDVDARTDIWSLGVVMYEMVARRRPFEAPTVSDAIARILQNDPAPLDRITPPALQRILVKAMAKERQSRYASAADLRGEIRTVRASAGGRLPAMLQSFRGRWKVSAAGLAALAAVAIGGTGLSHRAAPPVREPLKRTMLAVLPFENLGGDASQEYFADGLTEDMTSEFGRLAPKELGVIARTSTMRYKRTVLDARKIGRDLGVDYLIEGSVRRNRDHVRVAAQLIRAADGTHVWAETYDRKVEDAFTVQSTLARDVAREANIKLGPRGAVGRSDLPRTEVGRDAYLRGRYEMQFGKVENREKALKYFTDAAASDPGSALVQTEMARAILSLATYRYAPRYVVPRARRSAQKALELDDGLAEAHQVMGQILLEYDWKWRDAERELRRAIELNPNLAVAHATYASLLISAGRFDEGLQESAHAMALDPLSPAQHEQMLWQWASARRWKETISQSRQMLEIEPTRSRSYHTLAIAYLAVGDNRSALAAAEHESTISDAPIDKANVAYVYARVGKTAEARKLLNELHLAAMQSYVCSYNLAGIHGVLGEMDLAFASLEQAFKDDSG